MDKAMESISFIIPTLNEEINLPICLSSILEQDYPLSLIEVLIIDAGSTDKTTDIAEEFKKKGLCVNIIDNSNFKNPETAKMLGLKNAKGKLFYCIDADAYLSEKSFLKKMIIPFLKERDIPATFTSYLYNRNDGAVNRFISFNKFQCDPFFEYITPPIENFFYQDKKDYKICKFSLGEKIPPLGGSVIIYRRELLLKYLDLKNSKFMDVDTPVIIINHGYNYFAYVSTVGVYHKHANSLLHLLKKRLRNIDHGSDNGFLPNFGKRTYVWIDFGSKKEMLSIIRWFISVQLIFPKLIKGIMKSIKHRDMAGMLEPVLSLLVTDLIVYGLLRDKRGRSLFLTIIGSLFRKRKRS